MRKDFGPQTWLYPRPVLIIGTYDEKGEPNAMNAAWGSIHDYNEIFISLGDHATSRNIRKNGYFTVSVATKKTMVVSDFVGLVSHDKDLLKMEKANLHHHKGQFANAPIFKEYPLTLECRVISFDDGQDNEGGFLIGEILNVSADEEILTDGKIDTKKLEPIAYDPVNHKYLLVDEVVGNAFSEGLKLK